MTTPFFSTHELRQYLALKAQNMKGAIESYHPNKLLNTDVDALVQYFVALGKVEPLAIREDGITVDQSEANVDVSRHPRYMGWGRDGQVIVPGIQLRMHLPFSGDPELLKFQASTHSFNPPRGDVFNQEIILSLTMPHADTGSAKTEFVSELGRLRQAIQWSSADVSGFNSSLESLARTEIEARRKRLLSNQNLVGSLGYPLRQRPDATTTYTSPEFRRKLAPEPPPSSTAPFVPEPVLSDANYEQILTTINNMVQVMERSPSTFASSGEEDIRNHILVQLNGQFDGRASAETFRGQGSTDILLIDQDRSVFIAECKIWRGAKSLIEAVDQVLDYSTWRDAKAAIVLFNRNKNFSEVLAQLEGILREHAQVAGAVQRMGETVHRFRLKQRDDANRLITVTLLVFNIPEQVTVSDRLTSGKGRRKKAPQVKLAPIPAFKQA